MVCLILLLTVLSTIPSWAQKSRTEVVRSTTPENDAKPNSASVPEALAVSANFERIVVMRFKYQADLLAGIEELVKKEKITNAVVLSGIGSVRNYHIHQVSNRTFPSKNVFIKDAQTPADIISINGYILNGKPHVHLTMADEEKAFGGHLEAGTNVFTFAILTLGVLPPGLDLTKLDDKTFR
jgi:predicted DNA-binding protein with PD1-like motif